MEAIKEYLRHEYVWAFVLVVALSVAIAVKMDVRLSDIDELLSRITYAIAEAARTMLN